MEPVTSVVTSNPQIQTPSVVGPPIPQSPPSQQLQVTYASFWRRFFASWIDGFILMIAIMIIVFLFNFLIAAVFPTSFTVAALSSIRRNVLSLVVLVISMIYFLRSIGKYGQTIGKKVLGIKVVDKINMQPVGYVKAFLREYVGKFLSSFLYLGFLWMIWDSQKQTWHDKIAGTVVVKV